MIRIPPLVGQQQQPLPLVPRQQEERPSSPCQQDKRPPLLRRQDKRPPSPPQQHKRPSLPGQQQHERPSLPRQQHKMPSLPRERPSSSMSNRSNSSNRTRSSSTEVRDSSSTPRRRTLGTFVYTNNGRTGICSAVHGTALFGILKLAGAHPTGLIGTLGHSNRSSWFQNNTTALFQANGPLGMFKEVSPAVLERHFAVAQGQAKEYFDWNHSTDQTSAAHEDVPQ
jgi:hypothetical protein